MANTANIMDLLSAGARAEEMRQRAISTNIANLETPGYRRVAVEFEALLAKALDSGRGKVEMRDLQDLDPEVVQPQNTTVKTNGNDVSLEMEIGEMVKNSLRHQTYMRLLAKKYAQIDRAIDVR